MIVTWATQRRINAAYKPKLQTFIFISAIVSSCGSGDGESTPTQVNPTQDEIPVLTSPDDHDGEWVGTEMTGVAEKGPFVFGTPIELQSLDASLKPTGPIFRTEALDDSGSFLFRDGLDTPFVELHADGYFYDETTGAVSNGRVTLNSISSPVTRAHASINTFTHLILPRVRKLIREGESFDVAQGLAERELFKLLDFAPDANRPRDVSSISLANDPIGGAYLVGIGAALTSAFSNVGDIQQFLNELAVDLEDGSLRPNRLVVLHRALLSLDTSKISQDMAAYLVQRNIAYGVPALDVVLDQDRDDIVNAYDNCPKVFNPDQLDTDLDGVGDVCAQQNPCTNQDDLDCDTIENLEDNCPSLSNFDQLDTDGDGIGDLCDSSPGDSACSVDDKDCDGIIDKVDNCVEHSNPTQPDRDFDGHGDHCDNCPDLANVTQLDSDEDGQGDVCDQGRTIPGVDRASCYNTDIAGDGYCQALWTADNNIYCQDQGVNQIGWSNFMTRAFAAEDLQPVTSWERIAALSNAVTDLDTRQIFVFAENDTGAPTNFAFVQAANYLIALTESDENRLLYERSIPLSETVSIGQGDALFSGRGQAIIYHTVTDTFTRIDLRGGVVTAIGAGQLKSDRSVCTQFARSYGVIQDQAPAGFSLAYVSHDLDTKSLNIWHSSTNTSHTLMQFESPMSDRSCSLALHPRRDALLVGLGYRIRECSLLTNAP